MARPPRSDGKQQVYLYICKNYRYASTQPMVVDPHTGKKKLTRILWGKVSEDFVFSPNSTFRSATSKERDSLEFPPEWDVSAIQAVKKEDLERAHKLVGPGRPSYTDDDVNRLYGDIWLLEQICKKTGMEDDLLAIFDGDKGKVADLLTLAFFPYVTTFSYHRVARWQRICKSPSSRLLSDGAITIFMQSLTEQNRMDLFRRRKQRLGEQEFLAVDSTSRNCFGSSLSSIRWGKNKEGDTLAQTNELVVYGLESHMPVYYRQLPGNSTDTRTIDVLISELEHAGFKKIPLLVDRGYASVASLELLMKREHPFVMCSKVNWSLVSSVIDSLGIAGDGTRPECFSIDPQYRMYHYQQALGYTINLNGGRTRESKDLRLNLYYDPTRRGNDIVQIDIDTLNQEKELNVLIVKGLEVTQKEVKRYFPYFSVTLDTTGKYVTEFTPNKEAAAKALKLSGFIAIISHKVEGDSKRIWDLYHLRDEQEKYFYQMKTQLAARRTRAWSEEGHEGRLFVLFVALTFSSYLKQVYKSTDLSKKFTTSLEILDEMRSIRCIEHTHRAKKITPFIGKQLDICEAFGFDVPKGCNPTSKQKRKKNPMESKKK
jgi:transposase